MDLKLLVVVFSTIFVAELGDKTQLATLLYAAKEEGAGLPVFLGSASALVLTSALAVLAGSLLSQQLSPKLLSWIAGVAFIGVGVWTLLRA